MSIHFKTVAKGQPGVAGGGVKKYYASVVSGGEADIESITRSIERMCTVNGADIRAVLYALVEVASEELSKGNIVRLGDLGSMRVSISSEGCEKEDDVSASSIKDAYVLFTPGKMINNTMATLSFKKA